MQSTHLARVRSLTRWFTAALLLVASFGACADESAAANQAKPASGSFGAAAHDVKEGAKQVAKGVAEGAKTAAHKAGAVAKTVGNDVAVAAKKTGHDVKEALGGSDKQERPKSQTDSESKAAR
jgi:hypothetical protein